MPVVFKCDCGKYLSVRSKYIGKKIKCPVCGEVNKVPDPTEKKAKQLRRLETKALETEKFRRLKDAVDEDRDIALEEKELVELELPGSGEISRSGEGEADGKRPAPEPRPRDRSEHRAKEKTEHRAKEKSESRVKDRSESHVKDKSESRVKDRIEPRESHGEKPERKERSEQREKSEHREKPEHREKSREKAHEKAPAPKGGTEIQCFCGKKHAVGPEKKGKSFTCDSCGRVINVPGDKAEKLDLVPLEEGDPCPKCGALLRSDEKVCHACGHRLDQRFSGRHGADPGAAKKKSKHR